MDSKQASSSSSLCPPTLNFKYEAFLRFRGEDPSWNFADHLYSALKLKGINVFMDDKNFRRGTTFEKEHLQTIKDSRISVIIFSKNYASSTWCLNELAQAHECMKAGAQIVLPVFYHVDPFEVRTQTGRCSGAIPEHKTALASKEGREKLDKWNTALTEVAWLYGWDLSDRKEAEVIQEIVEDIFTKLCPSCLPTLNKCEVFLSFRGEDTRKNFTDHFYSALEHKGFNTFRAVKNAQRGKDIREQFFQALRDSRILVIIFSMNYACSSFCLDELAQAHECMKSGTQIVLPVFYGVNPSDVRKQTGSYAIVSGYDEKTLASRESGEKLFKWRTALTEVASLPGWDINNRPQAAAIQQIVEDIFTKLGHSGSGVSSGQIGMDLRLDELIAHLCMGLNDVRMVAIWGMAGIGKTTLAKVVFEKLSSQFDASCFLSDVREADERRDLVSLQQKLLDDIFRFKNIKLSGVHQGIDLISQRLRGKNVLIVLDDVNKWEQLESLAGSPDWFGPGSRVIFTTKDEHLSLKYGLENKPYRIKGLNPEESLKLLCTKAFDSEYPAEGYLEPSDQVVKYCSGLPLALQVLGSFFRGKSIAEWHSALERLKDNPVMVWISDATLTASDLLKKLNLVLSNHSNGLVNGFVDRGLIGKLFVSTKKIAEGSNGTVVLEGSYDGRSVAVKRLVKNHHDVASKEIQNLIVSDDHPNIVRYYGVESDQHFVYLALERCICSLNDLIHEYTVQSQRIGEHNRNIELWKASGYPSVHLLKLMREIVSGLAHLHKRNIVHRDLKPQNVLIIDEESFCAKISDMGISKRLPEDKSFFTHATGYGTPGWQAPELLRNGLPTYAADIFSLGCVLYFCITKGKHPFGDIFKRDGNILEDQKDLSLIGNIPEAVDLFSRLLDPNPDKRPEAQEVYYHPLFWTSKKRLSFLQEASDRFEGVRKKNESDLLNALEREASVALGGNWNEKMHKEFIKYIVRRRKYKYDSVCDLVRVIRNQSHHYGELDQEIRNLLGSYPEEFDNYFSSRFPKLLIEVYKVVCEHCKQEKWFHETGRAEM